MSLLTKLNQWQVAPPPPTQEDNSGGGRNNEWDNAIFNQFENLLWMIEEKHWKNSIHIGRDFISIGRLRHIPESSAASPSKKGVANV